MGFHGLSQALESRWGTKNVRSNGGCPNLRALNARKTRNPRPDRPRMTVGGMVDPERRSMRWVSDELRLPRDHDSRVRPRGQVGRYLSCSRRVAEAKLNGRGSPWCSW
jgi:hypothetical protein